MDFDNIKIYNGSIKNFDNIKIYNGSIKDNMVKIYEDTNKNIISCSKNISSPRKMLDDDGENKYLTHYDLDADILENIYLVYELHDDFDTNNIDILIDLLSDTNFNINLGITTIFDINLSISCIFENDNPILYIQSDILQYQIQNGECTIDNHQYKELIEKCMLIYKKFIIMPISFSKFIDYIICQKLNYVVMQYKYKNINKTLYDFIKSINLSEQTISLSLRNKYDEMQDILTLETLTYKLDKYFHQIICKMPYRCIYFTLKISPNYEKIDKNLWNEAIYMLPNINNISYLDKKINLDEMLIRTTKNCHIYFYFMNPNEKLKLKLKYINPIERTKDIIKKYFRQIPTDLNTYCDKLNSSYKQLDDIIFDIDVPQIPVNVIISFYEKKNILYNSGLTMVI